MPELGDFAGRWRVTRRIDDRLSGLPGLFEGQAQFTPDAAGLAYHEQGTLRLGSGTALAASQRYLWRAGPEGIVVHYADGAPFHHFANRQTVAQAWHSCGADSYEVSYGFSRWPAWRATWQVRGPRKDYRSVTDYLPWRGA